MLPLWIGNAAGICALVLVLMQLWSQKEAPEAAKTASVPTQVPVVAAPRVATVESVPQVAVTTRRIAGSGAELPIISTPLPDSLTAHDRNTPTPLRTSAPPHRPPAGGVVSAADAATLKSLAEEQAKVVVEGEIASVVKSSSGKIVRVFFKGETGRDSFYVGYFEGLYAPMSAKFGPDAHDLEGKKVHIKGTIKLFQGTPNIILESVEQVSVIP